jgi:hypothetical protein
MAAWDAVNENRRAIWQPKRTAPRRGFEPRVILMIDDPRSLVTAAAARSISSAIKFFYGAHSFFLVAPRRAILYRVVFPPRVRELSPR